MTVRVLLASCVWIGGIVSAPAAVQARVVHYVLGAGSMITPTCNSCGQPPAPSEALAGAFELATLPVPGRAQITAVGGLSWHSDSFTITGSGFLQREGADSQMVLETRLNGATVVFASGPRQQVNPSAFTVVLSSPRNQPVGYLLVLVAQPTGSDESDGDADSIADSVDSCPAAPNFDQHDADSDGVGDACDKCTATPGDESVVDNGCSVSQLCPCQGPNPDAEWADQKAYVSCVGHALRSLRRAGRISRRDVVTLIQRAVQSGCGRTVLASR